MRKKGFLNLKLILIVLVIVILVIGAVFYVKNNLHERVITKFKYYNATNSS